MTTHVLQLAILRQIWWAGRSQTQFIEEINWNEFQNTSLQSENIGFKLRSIHFQKSVLLIDTWRHKLQNTVSNVIRYGWRSWRQRQTCLGVCVVKFISLLKFNVLHPSFQELIGRSWLKDSYKFPYFYKMSIMQVFSWNGPHVSYFQTCSI